MFGQGIVGETPKIRDWVTGLPASTVTFLCWWPVYLNKAGYDFTLHTLTFPLCIEVVPAITSTESM